MTFSDAHPIKFWPVIARTSSSTLLLRILYVDPTYASLNTPTTFNELQNTGPINSACFYPPMDFSDDLVIQFESTSGQNYVLNMIRKDHQAYLFNQAFTEVLTGVYQLTISSIGSALGGGSGTSLGEWGRYQFSIGTAATSLTSNIILNPTFTSGANWTNQSDGGEDWTTGSGAEVDLTPSDPNSNRFLQSFADTNSNQTSRVFAYGTAQISGDSGRAVKGYVRFYFYKNGAERTELRYDSPIEFNSNSNSGLTSSCNVACKLLIPANTSDAGDGTGASIDQFAFSAHLTSYEETSITLTVTISSVIIRIYADNMVMGAKSDYYDFSWNEWRELQSEKLNDTVLVRYSNETDSYGLTYENLSPAPEFNLRVPGLLFHETYPQEEEVHELSSDEWVKLWSETHTKRLLQVNHCPDYFHKIIELALSHDYVTAGIVPHISFTANDNAGENAGMQAVKRDPYQKEEGSWRYPLKKATVQLTDKTTIERNLI